MDIECLPKDLPESIEIDVTELNVGDAIHVSNLSLPDVTILHADDQTIVTVVPPRIVAETETEELGEVEEAAEPEVISKGKDEEGESESE
jgi:large subunit ribosomal protein L25